MMITIQSGKLTIPEEERFVGFEGDHLGSEKRFVIPQTGDINGRYSLCLRFDDDSVREIPLDKEIQSGELDLIWRIRSEHLLKSGIVMGQVKYVDMNDVVKHSTCDYFIVAGGADLADESENDYVTRKENEEMMTTFLNRIRASAPYIGEDNRWYYYDAASDAYVGSLDPVIFVDSEMISGSTHAVQSRAIQQYVSSGLAAKADKTIRVAGIALNGNIPADDLAVNLAPYINPRMVEPGETVGLGGQYGKTTDGVPVMCTLGTTWVALATAPDVEAKMALAPSVNTEGIDDLPTGQIFFCHGGLGIKVASGYIEFAKRDTVYSKSEIDSMIGDIETLLSAV